MRHELALGVVDDVRRLDEQIKESHRRIRTAVRASNTSLTELFGVGPIVACAVIGYTGDVRHFANRDHWRNPNVRTLVELRTMLRTHGGFQGVRDAFVISTSRA